MPGDDMLDNPILYDGVLSRRFWAYIVDVLLISLLNLAVHVALFMMGIVTIGILMLPAMALMAVISFLPLALLYDTLTLGGAKAATPGMRLFDLESHSNTTGGRPDYFQAFVMSLLFYVTLFATSGLLLLVVFFTRRNMALHDILSGVVVTRHIGEGR
jgi:uncharacterized RDD family membrane protein YckC